MTNLKAIQAFLLGMAAAVFLAATILLAGAGLAAPALAYSNNQPSEPVGKLTASQPNMPDDSPFAPWVVPAAAFSSDGADPDGFHFNFAGYIDGSGTACLKAPAYLPNGAIVTDLYASLYDNFTSDIFLDLRRVNITDGDSNVLASVSTTGASAFIQSLHDETINYAAISYPLYAYYVTVCLNSADHRLYSVRIYSEQRIFLPLVVR